MAAADKTDPFPTKRPPRAVSFKRWLGRTRLHGFGSREPNPPIIKREIVNLKSRHLVVCTPNQDPDEATEWPRAYRGGYWARSRYFLQTKIDTIASAGTGANDL